MEKEIKTLVDQFGGNKDKVIQHLMAKNLKTELTFAKGTLNYMNNYMDLAVAAKKVVDKAYSQLGFSIGINIALAGILIYKTIKNKKESTED